jgi:GTP-binding protein Era
VSDIKSGFVAVIGRPSAGKSTLINRICGFKVSIVSKHPQTTRFIVRGIYNDDTSQIIFIDTPGYHQFNSNLNRGLSNLAVRSLDEGDLILYLVDTTRPAGSEEQELIQILKNYENKLILVFNKMDHPHSHPSETREDLLRSLAPLENIEISGMTGKNVKKLLELLKKHLDNGPLYYPEDFVTDQNPELRISEIVREQVFLQTEEEVPHSCYVEVTKFDLTEKKLTAYADIFVERETQKGILIGSKGAMIKKIGQKARELLKEVFERDADLFLQIKVNKDWRKNDALLKKMFQLE